jgi:amidase
VADSLWRWDAVALASAIRNRQVSAREALQAVLDRMDQVNPAVNAVVVTRREDAYQEADRADAAVRRGDRLGPLHGVPVTIKDNVDQAGFATINGVAANRALIAQEDSPPVAAWRGAGAVIVGRTNTPAFSLRWDTDNDVWGRTFNPWDRTRTPGGSSGGAAAALAVGIGPLAHGTDLGGSIRYPAYCCGVAGIRPTLGRVASFNATAATERPITGQLMAVQGVLARRICDVTLGYQALCVRDPRDPWWAPAPLDGPPPSLPIKVALWPAPAGMEVDGSVASAVRQAGSALAAAGYQVEEVPPPNLDRVFDVWAQAVTTDLRSTMAATIAAHGDDRARTSLGLWFDLYPPITLDRYVALAGERLKYLREWSLFLEQYPIIVGPTSAQPPFPIGFDHTDHDASRALMRAQMLLAAVNCLGLPAVAVPVGGYRGGPLGVQVIAGRYREDLALAAAAAIEASAPMATPIDPH